MGSVAKEAKVLLQEDSRHVCQLHPALTRHLSKNKKILVDPQPETVCQQSAVFIS